ncbi:hypothetical protein F0562_012749 [Nyssa sinensis]|uniref:Protein DETOXIFICATION n=1 Tax=Nyssa sinensis TaxID=561372 RepID=A0A5J4ZY08_9ASTE|nr:hypothetical protein F0562_012749 [Nyssa sinensis]
MDDNPIGSIPTMPPSPPVITQKWPANFMHLTLSELKRQIEITFPLVAMNLTWFAKIAITTAFLGQLGELKLAGGTLGFTFANFTGFSVLNGLCAAMEPICGQAYGAKNFRLLHKTLVMTTLLLLLATLPISFLWLNVDKILIHFGQQEDISIIAKKYLFHLLPDLVITSFLCPLKAYLSSQSITVPILLSSALGVAFHVPVNILLSKAKGLEGVSMAVWISDLVVVILLAFYVLMVENSKGGRSKEGGWWEHGVRDWIRLLKLCAPCCLTSCLEWWCYEILVLLTGRLENAKQVVGVLAIVLNFDYLLYSVMLSLATCASIRVSNDLGTNHAGSAYQSACVSLALSIVSGCVGGLVMVAARGIWGPLFSHDKGVIRGVKKMMLLMALVEVANFPLAVCGGIVRGTARPWPGHLCQSQWVLLAGFAPGLFVARIDWIEEAGKAQLLASIVKEVVKEDGDHKNLVENASLTNGELSLLLGRKGGKI